MSKCNYNRVVEKGEYSYLVDATANNKVSKSGIMKLTWFYIKKFKFSFGEGLRKAYAKANERIAQINKSIKMDLSDWTKRS